MKLKKSIIRPLLLSILASSLLTACGGGSGSSTPDPVPSPSPSPSPTVHDISIAPLPDAAMSTTLQQFLGGTADAMYGTNISYFAHKIYGNSELSSPNPMGWIAAAGAQYAFGYNVPYVQTYSPSVISFLSPLAVGLQCNNKQLFFVLQPVSNPMDTQEAFDTQGASGTNVIIKYHSLFSNGLAPYPTAFNADFMLNSIDNVKYTTSQTISIHAHDGIWSPANNNIPLQAAFLDYNPHVILSQMSYGERSIYSVNNLISYAQLSIVLNILQDLPADKLTLSNFRNAVKPLPELSIITNALDSYNQLVTDNCGYSLWDKNTL